MTTILSYIYIFEYQHLKNVGIKFDDAYDISYDERQSVLSIRENVTHINGLYGDKISMLTAIVGNNGVGKSTCLRSILNTIVYGASNYRPGYALLVWRNNTGFHFYCKDRISINKQDGININPEEEVEPLLTFLYSGNFTIGNGDATTVEWSGAYLMDNMALLNNDIQSYANIDAKYFDHYQYRVNAHVYQNMFRIGKLIADYREILAELNLNMPQYMSIYPNRSAYLALCNDKEYKGDIIGWIKPYLGNDLSSFVVQAILNKAKDCHRLETFEKFCDEISSVSNDAIGIIDLCNVCMPFLGEDFYAALAHVCNSIEQTFVKQNNVYSIDMTNEDEKRKLKAFMHDCYNINDFIVARFFDIQPTYVPGKYTVFSSGELQFLNLLSRIMYVKEKIDRERAEDAEVNPLQILFLDEAEIGMHPEWQRQYIGTITKFINRVMDSPVQIVITTHSPIILSDIIHDDIQYLKKGEEGTTNVSERQPDTFAANIFDLYRNAFFLEKGFIGTFACDKIKKLDGKNIEDVTEDDRLLIEKIGDERIKAYFMSKLMSKDEEIEILERRLAELKGQ